METPMKTHIMISCWFYLIALIILLTYVFSCVEINENSKGKQHLLLILIAVYPSLRLTSSSPRMKRWRWYRCWWRWRWSCC